MYHRRHHHHHHSKQYRIPYPYNICTHMISICWMMNDRIFCDGLSLSAPHGHHSHARHGDTSSTCMVHMLLHYLVQRKMYTSSSVSIHRQVIHIPIYLITFIINGCGRSGCHARNLVWEKILEHHSVWSWALQM